MTGRRCPTAREVRPVLIVVPARPLLLDIAGPAETLRRAGMAPGGIAFALTYVSPLGSVVTSVGLPVGPLAPLPEELPEGVIVMVVGAADAPPGEGDADARAAAASRRAIVTWLECVVGPALGRQDGPTLVSICSGALLLGEAGLLHRRRCTTHFGLLAELERVAPTAAVVADRLFVEDGPVWTSAGVTAGIDLTLQLVASIAGPAVASDAARHLVVYLRRSGGDPQLSPWLEGRNHMHPAIHRVQDAITAEPTRDWSAAELAHIGAASERNLSRLFRRNVGTSLPDYVNRLRVALAAELLAHSSLPLEQVAERSGFGSARQLRRVWSRHFPEPPSAHREAVRRDEGSGMVG